MNPLIEELRVALDGDSAKLVAELLAGVPEADRVPCRTLMKHYRENRFREAWVVAAAGLESGAAALARRLRTASPPTSSLPIEGYHPDHARTSGAKAWPLAADVLLDRRVSWLPDLVVRLAEVDQRGWGDDRQVLTERLRLALDLPRPHGSGYLRWVAQQQLGRPWRRDDRSIAERLRAEPDADALVAALLTVPGVGTELNVRRGEFIAQWGPEGWHAALQETLADGTLDRDRFLDALLGALLLGGPVAHQHDLAVVLDDARVSPRQTATRVAEFGALIPAGAGPVAGAALSAVRAAVAAGAVAPREAVEATAPALHRREKGLVRAHLRWLVDLARRHPDVHDDVLLGLAEVYAHEHHDLARQAWEAVGALCDDVPRQVLEEVRRRAEELPPDVRRRAVEALGGAPGTEVDEVAAPPDAEPSPPPGPHPPRVQDLDELVAAIAQHSRHWRPADAERVLDGVARFGARDMGELLAALTPVADRFGLSWEHTSDFAVYPFLAAATRHPGAPRWRGAKPPRPGALPPGGDGVLALRAQEVVDRVRAGESGGLLSFPDTATGHVDPDRVLGDLEHAATAGTKPWPADLEQAWLRFPREEIGTASIDRLRAVGTPATDWLLQQLVSPRPEALAAAEPVPARGSRSGYRVEAEGAGLPAVSLRGSGARTPLARLGLDGEALPARVVEFWWWGGGFSAAYSLSCMPSHREVAAGHLVATLVNTEKRRDVPVASALAVLPEAQGPTGRATHLALAYALLSCDDRVRLAALDAVAGFAVRGGLDGPAAGAALGELLVRQETKPVRAAKTLAPLAHDDRPRVRGFVAQYLLAALTPLLPLRRNGSADLLALAADACHETGPHPRIPGLAEIVDSGGRTRLVVEARRLHALLQP